MERSRVHVVVDSETHQKLKAYSELTGVPITTVASQALADWMETVGAARLDAMTAMSASDNVIEMPNTNVSSAAAAQA